MTFAAFFSGGLPVNISTHTLTWSVTIKSATIIPPNNISTHTLTWSVTSMFWAAPETSSYFNSHAHVERDGQTDGVFQFDKDFNSHAHVERDT